MQKNIRFPEPVVHLIAEQGSIYGLSFNKFVQNLVISKAQEITENRNSLIADVLEARSLSAQGKLPSASTREEIERYVMSVFQDEEE
jgi:uncharacterized protein (DUF1778 family)